MILRKPYAILIKYFKIIHFVLLGLTIYLAFMSNDVLRFLNDFIANRTSSINATGYLSVMVYPVIVLIIGICIAIYYLMREKKKPKLLYLLIILFYIITAGVLIYSSVNLNIIENDILESSTLRLVRDILRIDVFGQYIVIAAVTIRALGFDIKKFDFAKDINELQIDVTDNEEFEFMIGVNTDNLKRKGRKQLRELRYYFVENKLFITIILSVIAVVGLIVIILNINFFNKVYNEDETVQTALYNLTFTDSYLTKYSYNQQDIGYNNTSYVIVKFNIDAINEGTYQLDTNKFLLEVEDERIAPTKRYYEYLKDIATGYRSQNIDNTTTKTYILVYNIDNEYLNKEMTLRYEEGYVKEEGNWRTKQYRVNLDPVSLDQETTLISTSNLNQSLELTNSFYSNTKFTISNYSINDRFAVTTNYCTSAGNCSERISQVVPSTNKATVLSLTTTDTSLNSQLSSFTDLITNYGKIKYELNGKEYTSSILNNITPSNYNKEYYIEVDKNITSASKIWIELNIRSNQYQYILKES